MAAVAANAAAHVLNNSVWTDGSVDEWTWTPSGAGDSRTVMTFEAVIQRLTLGSVQRLFMAADAGGNNIEMVYFDANDKLVYEIFVGGVSVVKYVTTAMYRDPIAWYHTHVTRNGNTVTITVNGTAVTDFDTSDAPTGDNGMFGHTEEHSVAGQVWSGANYGAFNYARLAYLDGVSSAASTFIETDDNGGLVLLKISGLSYGTNGFLQLYEVAPGTGNGAGTDSANTNHFLDVSMTAAQQTTHSPTDDADNDIGSYAAFNPLWWAPKTTGVVLSEGNQKLTATSVGTDCQVGLDQGMMNGKWHVEFTVDSLVSAGHTRVGLAPASEAVFNTDESGYWNWFLVNSSGTGKTQLGGVNQSTGLTEVTAGQRVYLDIDLDNGNIAGGINGTEVFSETGHTFATGLLTLWFQTPKGKSMTITMNTGATAFTDTPATDHVGMSTANLLAPTITNPSDYFQLAATNHGGTSEAVTCNWDMDVTDTLIISKNRDASEKWYWSDGLQGETKYNSSDQQTATTTDANVHSVSGTTLTLGSTFAVNNYVTYMLKAGAAGGVSNTDGSITSQVSVNADHGNFSIVTYTGSGVAATVGHGLSNTPGMYIVKNLTTGTHSWYVYHDGVGATKAGFLDLTSVFAASSTYFNNTDPTTSVFSIGTNAGTNGSTNSLLAYCFARTPGLIGIGSYTGNSSADGTYIVIDDGASGFRPAWVLLKSTTNGSGWFLFDNKRDPYNYCRSELSPNTTGAEEATWSGVEILDFTANGFKHRKSTLSLNNSSHTYVYLAFAENPFGGEGVAQARAR